jgi:hypothetical protein
MQQNQSVVSIPSSQGSDTTEYEFEEAMFENLVPGWRLMDLDSPGVPSRSGDETMRSVGDDQGRSSTSGETLVEEGNGMTGGTDNVEGGQDEDMKEKGKKKKIITLYKVTPGIVAV